MPLCYYLGESLCFVNYSLIPLSLFLIPSEILFSSFALNFEHKLQFRVYVHELYTYRSIHPRVIASRSRASASVTPCGPFITCGSVAAARS
jgi:hypothetical protein